MNVFFADPSAPAQAAPSTASTGLFGMLIWLVAIFAIFYFIAILPQRRREKQHRQMVESIRRGDVVVTVGGVVGKVIDVRKDTLKIKSANVTELEVRKASIAGVVSKASQQEGISREDISEKS